VPTSAPFDLDLGRWLVAGEHTVDLAAERADLALQVADADSPPCNSRINARRLVVGDLVS
jgi:hypothetical protein